MSNKISVKPFITTRSSDGTYPVRFRVTFHRANTSFTSNIRAFPDQLTRSLKIKDDELLDVVKEMQREYQSRINSIHLPDIEEMTLNDIIKLLNANISYHNGIFHLDFIRYGNDIAATKIKSSGENYRSAIKALIDYTGKEKLDIMEITSSFLYGLESHLILKYGRNARAVSLYLGHIRTIHYRAQREFNNPELGKIPIKNPFISYSVPRPPTPKHRDVPAEIIQDMINNRRSLKGAQRTAVDAYLLSFALMGMNSVDMYECEKPNGNVLH